MSGHASIYYRCCQRLCQFWIMTAGTNGQVWQVVHCRSLPPRRGAPHTLLTPPHSSLLLHRYLLYPQPNVIGLSSILRNCFPPVPSSPSVTFTYLLCSRALSSSLTSLCHRFSAANRKCNASWRRVLNRWEVIYRILAKYIFFFI